MNRMRLPVAVCLGLLLTGGVGCGPTKIEGEVQKKPRPVDTMRLEATLPPNAAYVSASVASWKTEQIGFEVGGRIEWVLEPGKHVDGRVFDEEGNVVFEGTKIAKIDSERYRLQFESAIKEVDRARKSVESAEIELERSIPAQKDAARAELQLAKTELDRSQGLLAKNAASQADVDVAEANFKNAKSRLDQLEASLVAKQAEVESLKLQVEQALQAQKDAQRSLDDCTLYSSFSGQIAEVDVVPGSVISPGEAIVTVQMMDPIKLELEVSAADSRRLRKRQRIPVFVPKADREEAELETSDDSIANGELDQEMEFALEPSSDQALPLETLNGTFQDEELKDGFLYLIDPVADPQTRTFTLTLLMLNERTVAEPDSNTAITDQAWRLDFEFLPGSEQGKLYIAEQAIRYDSEGPFLWRILDLDITQNLPPGNVVHVAKMRVTKGEARIPFLGNWYFQEVIVADDDFDPSRNLVAGKLTVEEGTPDDWVGSQIRIDRSNEWMVRPGDLVRVDISEGDVTPGIFVPMDALSRDEGKTYVYVVEQRQNADPQEGESDQEHVVRRTEVQLADSDDLLSETVRIKAKEGEPSLSGSVIVTRGAHYLRDGEVVRVPRNEEEE